MDEIKRVIRDKLYQKEKAKVLNEELQVKEAMGKIV